MVDGLDVRASALSSTKCRELIKKGEWEFLVREGMLHHTVAELLQTREQPSNFACTRAESTKCATCRRTGRGVAASF